MSMPSQREAIAALAANLTEDLYRRSKRGERILLGSVPVGSANVNVRLAKRRGSFADFDPYEPALYVYVGETSYKALMETFADLLAHELSHAKDRLSDPIDRFYTPKNKRLINALGAAIFQTMVADERDRYSKYESLPREEAARALAKETFRRRSVQKVFEHYPMPAKEALDVFTAAWRSALIANADRLMGGKEGKEKVEEGKRKYFNSEGEVRAYAAQIASAVRSVPGYCPCASKEKLIDLAKEVRVYKQIEPHLTDSSRAILHRLILADLKMP